MDDFESSASQAVNWADVIARAVHDMRTPLSSMRVALEIFRLNGESPELRTKLLGMLNNHVDELSALLETLVTDPLAFNVGSREILDTGKTDSRGG